MKLSSICFALLLILVGLVQAGENHDSDDAFWADAAALLPGFNGTPVEPGPSNQDGLWGNVIDWPHVPVSAASLPNGKILTFSGQERGSWPGTKTQTYWTVFDPATNRFDESLYLNHEMFCAHLVMRTDGTLQTVGGRYTVEHSSVFDFRSNEWKRVADLNDRRWYTTAVALPDGDIFTVAGSGGPNTAERFSDDTQQWTKLTGIDWQPVSSAAGFESNWWPYLWVAPNGQLFHFGPTEAMHWVSPDGNGQRTSAGISVPNNHYPKHAGVTMYDSGKILVAGGAATMSGGSSNICYTVDLNTNPPTVQQVASMTYPRRFSNAVMLPSGEVMIVGGNTSGQKFSDNGTVLTPEIWNPRTNTWREVADMARPRNYHSVGLLLADGRVFAGGNGYSSPNQQNGEIFTPPALFDSSGQLAPRPTINDTPDNVSCGSVFQVQATDNLKKFAAIRLIATTHGLSTDQRYLSLPFSETTAGNYQLVAHPNPNVMVPGYWMLFGLNSDGVHSKSKIIYVNETGNAPSSGLTGSYFNSTDLTNKRFERIDHAIDFNYGTLSPDTAELGNDNFSMRWEGWVIPEFTGTYTFYTLSDDGTRLWVNDSQLIDNWTDHPPTEDSGMVSLAAGSPVPIKLEYYEATSGSTIELRWSGPGTTKEIIPEKNLRHANPASTATIAADGVFELYVDGQLVSIGTEWNRAYHSTFQTSANAVIAIRACNTVGPGMAVGDFTINGERILTNDQWKVSTSTATGWNQPGFNDSSWSNATDNGAVPANIDGMPVNSPARQIWAADAAADEIFLRFSTGGVQLTQPNDQSNFAGESASLTLQAAGGQDPLTWSDSNLPPGLALNPITGVISGTLTPSGVGNYNVTITATDSLGDFAQVTFNWRVLGEKIIQENFEANTGDFDYRDDTFRETAQPSYASGSHVDSGGFDGSGGLQVLVGGVNEDDVVNMSGGWHLEFSLAQPKEVELVFRFLLNQPTDYDADEISQALVSLDGTLIGLNGNDYLAQLTDGIPNTTGWQSVSLALGQVSTGTHTITIGAFNNQKTTASEQTTLILDDVLMSGQSLPNAPPVVTVISDRANTVGENISLQVIATDPDNNALSYSASGLPPGLDLDLNSGLITGTSASAGPNAVTITVSDGNGGNDSTSFNWTINPAITIPDIIPIPSQSGSAISYTASPSGGTNPRYKWNFGDGSGDTAFSISPNVSHTYPAPGRYPVTFTATDDTGIEVSARFTQNIYPALTAERPNVSQSVLYEERPENDRVWNVNPDNATVSVFDAVTHAKLGEIAAGNNPRSLALGIDGDVWVVNKRSATISRIRTSDLQVLAPITLLRGSEPHGLVVDPQGQRAYVALEGSGEVVQFDAVTGAEVARLDVGPHPRHLSITADGSKLFVSRFISPTAIGENTATPDVASTGGELLIVGTSPLAVSKTITLSHSNEPDSGGGGRGIPNYLGPASISPAGDMAWLPSKQDNIERGALRDGRNLSHENTVRSITSRIDLLGEFEDSGARVDHDDAAVPSTALFGPNGLYLFVALEGSREVAVIDAYGQQELFRIDVGRAPQGLALSPDGTILYVHNFLSRTVSLHDVRAVVEQGTDVVVNGPVYNTLASEALTTQVLLGKQLFYDARDNRLSHEDYISCASCHNDGGHDGRVWDLTGFGEGLRNTIDLRGRGGMAHGPLHWSANFDEVQDFENQIHNLSQGTGLIADGDPHPPMGTANAGRSADLDALAAYVSSLGSTLDSPFRQADGSLTNEAALGKEIFRSHNCAQCHSGSNFTDSAPSNLHDIGTISASSGGRLGGALSGIDTPTLRGLWNGAPFLHDGGAATIAEAINAHTDVSISGSELSQVVAYLQQIDGLEPAAPSNSAPSLASPGNQTNDQNASVNLALAASDPNDDVLLFAASNLPNGLTIDSATGVISGIVTTAGTFNVTITVDDQLGGTDSVSFTWTVNAGGVAENDLLTNFVAPAIVQQGQAVMATIDYESTQNHELWIWVQDSNSGWRTVATDNLTLTPGIGTHTFNLDIAGNARVGDGYLWVIRLLPQGWTTADDALSADYLEVTVQTGTGGGGGDPTADQLGGVNFPMLVTSPGSVTLEVPYEATETRELRVWLHDPQDGYFSIAQGGTVVERGFGTHVFTLPVLPDARVGSGYLWALRLLPIDWTTADDALDANYAEASAERGQPGGDPTRDAFVSLQAPNIVQAASTTTVLIEYEATQRREIGLWLHDVNNNFATSATEVRTIEPGFGNEVFTLGVASDARLGDGHLWAIRLLPEGWATSDDALDEFYVDVTVQELDDNTSLINLATEFGATATQSSVFGTAFTANLAHDGNTDGDWRNGSVTHTNLDVNAWWEIDLGSVQDIAHINVWNRTDCCGDEWLSAYHVLVSNVPFTSTELSATISQSGVSDFGFTTAPASTQRVDVNRMGRYVRVQLSGANYLALAEIEIFGPGEIQRMAPQVSVASTGLISNDNVAASANIDGDPYDLGAEYALGSNPYEADSSQGLHLEPSEDGESVSVWYERPARLGDISYAFEYSANMKSWTTLFDGEVSSVSYGRERLTYSNFESRYRGFVRLRITIYDWNHETTTPITSWVGTTLREGFQTHGISLNQPALVTSTISSWSEDGVTMAAAHAPERLETNHAYYLEITSGPLAGHRVDINALESSDQTLAVDWRAAHNTLQTLPDASDWLDAAAVVRRHWTVADIYAKDAFLGSADPETADQLLFFNGIDYDSYFLLQAEGYHQWVAQDDDSLASADANIIPPGVGSFIKRPTGAELLTLTLTGEARSSSFVQPLLSGYNLLASPRPVEMNFRERAVLIEDGFTGSRDPDLADQIQRWRGDLEPGKQSYKGYFLLDADAGRQFWTEFGPDLPNVNDTAIFSGDRAFFLRLSGETHSSYKVPATVEE